MLIELRKIGLIFFITLLAQVLILRNIDLYNTAFCFGFLLFFIVSPKGIPVFNLFIAFLYGFLLDVFENTLGINMACGVLIMFLRPYLLRIVDIDLEDEIITLSKVGFRAFFVYSALIVFIYLLFFFFIEAFHAGVFWQNLGRVFASFVYTLIFVIGSQYLFFARSKR